MILAHATESTWHHKTSLPSRKQEAEPPLDACPGLRQQKEEAKPPWWSQQGLGSRNLLPEGSEVCIF